MLQFDKGFKDSLSRCIIFSEKDYINCDINSVVEESQRRVKQLRHCGPTSRHLSTRDKHVLVASPQCVSSEMGGRVVVCYYRMLLICGVNAGVRQFWFGIPSD